MIGSTPSDVSTSKTRLWMGRVIGALLVLFLAFDAGVKILKLRVAVQGTTGLGYPEHLVVVLGIVELICLIAYVVPSTSIIGAILLTGYLGGATATQVRVEDPWFIFPVVVGVLAWAGLFLRNGRFRALFSLQSVKASLLRIGAVLCVLLLIVVAFVAVRSGDRHAAKLRNPDLEYLKAVNSVAPPKDPELLFILMTEFANSNLQD